MIHLPGHRRPNQCDNAIQRHTPPLHISLPQQEVMYHHVLHFLHSRTRTPYCQTHLLRTQLYESSLLKQTACPTNQPPKPHSPKSVYRIDLHINCHRTRLFPRTHERLNLKEGPSFALASARRLEMECIGVTMKEKSLTCERVQVKEEGAKGTRLRKRTNGRKGKRADEKVGSIAERGVLLEEDVGQKRRWI